MDNPIVIPCPHCGKITTFQQRMENGSQVDPCRHCRKSVRLTFQSGELRDVGT
jgi:hypothetical protein